MLKAALNAVTALHSRSAMLKRLGSPDIYSPCKITPSNYFRFLRGPEYMTVKGREFILPLDSMTGQFAQLLTFDLIPGYGQFKIKYGANTTAFLDFDATAVDVQDALRAFEVLENVVVTGSFVTGFRIVFQGFSVRPALGEVVSSTLAVEEPPGPAEISVAWTTLQGNIVAVGEAVSKSSGADDWDNSAFPTQSYLNQEVIFRVKVNNAVGAWGFSSGNPPQSGAFQSKYVLGHFNPSDPTVISLGENGNITMDIGHTSGPTDEMEMRVSASGVVTAYKNDVLIYTFPENATGFTLKPFVAIWKGSATFLTLAKLIDPTVTEDEESEPVTAAWKNTSVVWTGERIKKGDRIVEGESLLTVDEIIEMHDLGAQVMAYRVRCD